PGKPGKSMLVRFFLFAVLLFTLGCKEAVPERNLEQFPEEIPAVTPSLDSSQYVWEGDYVLIQWEDLLNVHFIRQPHELLDTADIPQFSSKVSSLSGQKVIVEGFYIPVEETGDESIVILSA